MRNDLVEQRVDEILNNIPYEYKNLVSYTHKKDPEMFLKIPLSNPDSNGDKEYISIKNSENREIVDGFKVVLDISDRWFIIDNLEKYLNCFLSVGRGASVHVENCKIIKLKEQHND